jgi:hypothetical protein
MIEQIRRLQDQSERFAIELSSGQIASISVGVHPVEKERMAKLRERFAPKP